MAEQEVFDWMALGKQPKIVTAEDSQQRLVATSKVAEEQMPCIASSRNDVSQVEGAKHSPG